MPNGSPLITDTNAGSDTVLNKASILSIAPDLLIHTPL